MESNLLFLKHPVCARLSDQAYLACVTVLRREPLIHGRPFPANRALMTEWNPEVDRYVASGVDRRSAEEIEYLSKVGPLGGPLFRHWDARSWKGVKYQRSTSAANARSLCFALLNVSGGPGKTTSLIAARIISKCRYCRHKRQWKDGNQHSPNRKRMS